MAVCIATKPTGAGCESRAMKGSRWCYNYDPARSEERRRNASKGGRCGGRGRASSELAEIKALLSELTDRALGREGTKPLLKGSAAVVNQLINTRLRALEIERKIKETEELEARLEALEDAREDGRGGNRWRD